MSLQEHFTDGVSLILNMGLQVPAQLQELVFLESKLRANHSEIGYVGGCFDLHAGEQNRSIGYGFAGEPRVGIVKFKVVYSR